MQVACTLSFGLLYFITFAMKAVTYLCNLDLMASHLLFVIKAQLIPPVAYQLSHVPLTGSHLIFK